MKCIPTYETSRAQSVHRPTLSTSTTGWHSTFTTKKSKVEAVTMKTGLNGAAHEYVCFGGAEAGIPTSVDFYERKFPKPRKRDPASRAQGGTPTTTRGGRVGTLELEIGLTTNRKERIGERVELVGWRQRNAMLELKEEEEKGKF